MAAPATITIPLDRVRLTRSDLIRMPPVRYGGRGPYGHPQGVLRSGVGYWSGTVEFERQTLTKHPNKGIGGIAAFEAILAEIAEAGATFQVPMQNPRHGQSERGLVSYLNQADAGESFTAAEVGAVVTGAGGVIVAPAVGAATVDIMIAPGTRLTVNHELFMSRISAGTQNITAAKPDTIPEFPSATGQAVELEQPYAVGRAALNRNITMTRRGSWGGGWTIQWEEA